MGETGPVLSPAPPSGLLLSGSVFGKKSLLCLNSLPVGK